MPTKKPRKKPPVASQRKQIIYAFYLVQPFLQFFALIGVLFFLTRCSPLSPSTDKANKPKPVTENAVVSTSPAAPDTAEEPFADSEIEQAEKEIADDEEMPILSKGKFGESTRESLHADKATSSSDVKLLFQQRLRRPTSVLVIPLSAEEKQKLLRGSVRLNLAKRLSPTMSAETQKQFFSQMREAKQLRAKAVLVMEKGDEGPNAVVSIPLRTRVRLALMPGNEQAFLKVIRDDAQIDEAQKELIRSNLERALELAVVLE
jgi:hypothetical protein